MKFLGFNFVSSLLVFTLLAAVSTYAQNSTTTGGAGGASGDSIPGGGQCGGLNAPAGKPKGDAEWGKCAYGYHCKRTSPEHWQCMRNPETCECKAPVLSGEAVGEGAQCGGLNAPEGKPKEDVQWAKCPEGFECHRSSPEHWQCNRGAAPKTKCLCSQCKSKSAPGGGASNSTLTGGAGNSTTGGSGSAGGSGGSGGAGNSTASAALKK